ncbi:uncharacterized protein MKK02DRAFT_38978 [Dioszegia hungarica]|uniref:Uncharacterized protein n=1 Tax=Dioszegia hungarica TaxID=4972 RepID=A0AA38LU51_9TREE|nr:uncharacterized protein MKK02DRAFT_38978 [Dioszegia hungarica]KAI9634304.1 hypothetical protein MKK02DRAFT_38978 [Dioszegia hungarica]
MSIPVKYQPSALPFTELVQTLKQIKAERKPRASSSTSSKPNLSSSDASRVEVGTVTAKREALLAALTVPLRVDQRGFTLQEAAVWLGATKYYDPLWRYAEVKATGDCRAKGSMDVVCRQHLAGLRSQKQLYPLHLATAYAWPIGRKILQAFSNPIATRADLCDALSPVLFVIQQSAVVAEQVRPELAQRVIGLAEEMCRAWELLMSTMKEAALDGLEVAVNGLIDFCTCTIDREGDP